MVTVYVNYLRSAASVFPFPLEESSTKPIEIPLRQDCKIGTVCGMATSERGEVE
jgi:hypothetical protein